MANERSGESTSLWAGLAVGLGVCVAVGLVGVILFLMRRSSGGTSQPLLGQLPPPQYVPMPYPMPMAKLPSMPGTFSAPSKGVGAAAPFRPLTASNTRTLPSLSVANSQAVRVAGNAHYPIRVTIRPVGPPGAIVALSFSAAELNMPGLNPVTPTGFIFSIPVGHTETFDLDRGQSLYAKASDPGVRLSVASAHVPSA
jgi:hypothetical protein